MKIYKNRPEGNAYYIMGQVQNLLKAAGREKEIDAVLDKMTSGNYENLCAVAKEVTFGSIEVVFEDEP
jgi:hypothetical protein